MSKIVKRLLAFVGLVGGVKLIHTLFRMPPEKYSIEWIKGLTDCEWEKEREIVRQNMCNPKLEDSEKIGCHNILRLFDKVKSERDWAGKTPTGPAYHREHGYNLFKDD